MCSIGLTSVTFRNLPCREIIDACVTAGLSCIEWGSDVHIPQNDPDHAAAMREATRMAGLRVSSYGSYYWLGTEGQKLSDFRSYAETAHVLGAPIIRVWGGHDSFDSTPRETYDKLIDEARALCDMAAEYGLTVAFEYHENTLNDTGEHALCLIRDVCRENFGVYFQYDSSVSIEQNVQSLKMMLPHVKMIHVAYNDKEHNPFFLDEGEGEELWRRIIREVKNAGCGADFLFEFLKERSVEGLMRQTGVMKRLMEEN